VAHLTREVKNIYIFAVMKNKYKSMKMIVMLIILVQEDGTAVWQKSIRNC
jgi:hypothetical protein